MVAIVTIIAAAAAAAAATSVSTHFEQIQVQQAGTRDVMYVLKVSALHSWSEPGSRGSSGSTRFS
jgi:hypothetical protein